MPTNSVSFRQKLFLAFMLMILAISVVVYTGRKNDFGPVATPASQLTVTNPLVLKNWLPDKSYDYTLARLNDYAQANDIDVSSVTVTSGVSDDHGAYAFTVRFDPDPQQYHVDVLVNNFSSAISTSVTIEGVKQDVSVSSSNQNTSFSGIDSLVNRGLSSVQANNLQAAFTKFDSSARKVVIDTDTISSEATNTNDPARPQVFTFSVTIDSTSYQASVDYTDISAVVLRLTDTKTNKVVFDSGKVDSAN